MKTCCWKYCLHSRKYKEESFNRKSKALGMVILCFCFVADLYIGAAKTLCSLGVFEINEVRQKKTLKCCWKHVAGIIHIWERPETAVINNLALCFNSKHKTHDIVCFCKDSRKALSICNKWNDSRKTLKCCWKHVAGNIYVSISITVLQELPEIVEINT